MEALYRFQFNKNRTEKFDLKFDDASFALHPSLLDGEGEPWMKLSFHKCDECTLPDSDDALCPVAANLGAIVAPFNNDFSYTKVRAVVEFRDRKIGKDCDLQTGLSSMMGLVMATSGCPTLDFLRPMAYTHQPFASIEETFYRAISGYLIAQYIRMKNDFTPNLDLAGLKKIYSNINHVNVAFNNRLREFTNKDANLNALVALDVFAQLGSFSIDDNWLKQITPLFDI